MLYATLCNLWAVREIICHWDMFKHILHIGRISWWIFTQEWRSHSIWFVSLLVFITVHHLLPCLDDKSVIMLCSPAPVPWTVRGKSIVVMEPRSVFWIYQRECQFQHKTSRNYYGFNWEIISKFSSIETRKGHWTRCSRNVQPFI